MRRASWFVLAVSTAMASVVACGGGAARPGAAVPSPGGWPAPAEDAPATTTLTGADSSPKAICADVKPLSSRMPETPKTLFASDDAPRSNSSASIATRSHKAKDREYTIDDLKALEARKEWRELVMHLDDVPPAKRDAMWDALLDRAAPEWMAQTTKEKDPFEAFYVALRLVDTYPRLTKNKVFMDKRLEVSKTAFKECFEQSYRGARCVKAAQEFVATGDPNSDSSFAVAKVVRLGQNANVAIPFFQKGLEGRKSGAPECNDEDLKLSVLSALALPTDYDNAKIGRQVASGVCFEKLRPAIEAELKASPTGYYASNVCAVLKAKSAL